MDDSPDNILKKKGLPHHRFLSPAILILDLMLLFYISNVLAPVMANVMIMVSDAGSRLSGFEFMLYRWLPEQLWITLTAVVIGSALLAKEFLISNRTKAFLVNVAALVLLVAAGLFCQASILLPVFRLFVAVR